MTILVINAGSSSHKCALFCKEDPHPVWEAFVEWKEEFREAYLTVSSEKRTLIKITSSQEGLEKALQTLPAAHEIKAIGHRVVHGGEKFIQTTRITAEVKKGIEEVSYLAPLHNPANLEGIQIAEKLYSHLPQFAVFDTAFHSTLPETAATYPGPYSWRSKAIRRYGFHGISHQYCSRRAAQFLHRPLKELKIVSCHLGSGCSLAAIKEGKSIDTTMGMTPLEGLMMGTRSGTIDPGIILHLLKHEKLSPETIETMLYEQSGLWGISGSSSDMRDIIKEATDGKERSKLALDLFLYRLKQSIGSMVAALEGFDVLLFTAGIGEKSALIRENCCKSLAYLGLEIDSTQNKSAVGKEYVISTPTSSAQIVVIPTQEDREIANECWEYLS